MELEEAACDHLLGIVKAMTTDFETHIANNLDDAQRQKFQDAITLCLSPIREYRFKSALGEIDSCKADLAAFPRANVA